MLLKLLPLSKKYHSFCRHFRDGTVLDRVVWELSQWKIYCQQRYFTLRREYLIKRWHSIRESKGYLDLRTTGGAHIRLHGDSELAGCIYCSNFEGNERKFIWKYLRAGDVFVDVGANIGLFTVVAAHRVGPTGTVYAFEPASLPRQRLLENIKLNGFDNIIVEALALSDQMGELSLSTPMDGHDAWSSLAEPIAGKQIIKETINTVTWNYYASEQLTRSPAMIKIDVEGWENRVIKGGGHVFSGSDAPLLQVEFTDLAAQSAGSSCSELYDQLTLFGYTLCRYDANTNSLIKETKRASYPYVNLYATKRLDSDNQRLAGVIVT